MTMSTIFFIQVGIINHLFLELSLRHNLFGLAFFVILAYFLINSNFCSLYLAIVKAYLSNSYLSQENTSHLYKPSNSLRFLVLGSSKSGKSSTIESLAGHNAIRNFKTCQELKYVQNKDAFGCNIFALECGSFTEFNSKDTTDTGIAVHLTNALNVLDSFHLVLICITFKESMAEGSNNYIDIITTKLESSVLNNNVIVVVTHAEEFEASKEKMNFCNFENWVDQLRPCILKDLLNKCSMRCVFFQNKTENESIKKKQAINLLSMAEDIVWNKALIRYTSEPNDGEKFTHDESIGGEYSETPIQTGNTKIAPPDHQIKSNENLEGPTMPSLALEINACSSTKKDSTNASSCNEIEITNEQGGDVESCTISFEVSKEEKRYNMEVPTDIDLLLIGKRGNGKSALGNTILRRKAFLSKSSQESVTKKVAYEVSDFDNRIIKVVDGPGVGDTRMDNEKSVNLVMGAMEYAISANPRGYHAFLLVAIYGGRFTAEDQDTVKFLKQVFGENFVKNFCILVLTRGDIFEFEDHNLTFAEWCTEQTGVFKELLEECCNRVILFDNRTRDEEKKEKQLKDLIEMVDNLRWRDLRYTDENFQKAREAREKLMVEAKKPMLREESMNEVSLIIQKLHWIQENVEPEERLSYLDDLQRRATTLYDNIQVQDKGTGALHDITQTAKSIQVCIANEIMIYQRVIEDRENMRNEKELRLYKFYEELHCQREEYERQLLKDKIEGERRSKLLKEFEKHLRYLKEKMHTEREIREREFQKTLEEERRRQRKQVEDIENKYKAAKETHDEGFDLTVTLPFRKLFGS